MRLLTLHRFYQLLREAVIYYPLDQKVKPKTFAVIQNLSDLNESNLRKTFDDYDKGFFFSEQWAAADLHPDNITWAYPIVCTDLFSGTISGVESKSPAITNNITLRVLDTKDIGADDLPMRTYHEIEQDCSMILVNVLRYFQGVILAEVDGEVDYYHEGLLVATNTEYRKVASPNIFKTAKEPFYFAPMDTGIENTIGKEIRLDLNTSLCTSDAWNFANPVTARKLSCCG